MNKKPFEISHTHDKICSKCKTGAKFAYLDSVNTLCPWIRLLNNNKCKMFEPIDKEDN